MMVLTNVHSSNLPFVSKSRMFELDLMTGDSATQLLDISEFVTMPNTLSTENEFLLASKACDGEDFLWNQLLRKCEILSKQEDLKPLQNWLGEVKAEDEKKTDGNALTVAIGDLSSASVTSTNLNICKPMELPFSRKELLDIVRKHSEDLMTIHEMESASTIERLDGKQMDSRYWREMVDLFFVRGWGHGDTSLQFNHDALFDDMLFFVKESSDANASLAEGNETSTSQDKRQFFVRRWGNDLKKVVGDRKDVVDWRKSFFLNFICHSTFTLTIASCSSQALEDYRKSPHGPRVTPIAKVTKRVFASPNVARVDSDPPKLTDKKAGFPNIYFSVDDHSDSFSPMDLSNPDHCLCVVLTANGGAAFPMEGISNGSGSGTGSAATPSRKTSSQAEAFGEAKDGKPKVTLFSGFVNHSMIRGNFHGGPSGSLFMNHPLPAERLVMKGPGGRGEADVTVWEDSPLSAFETQIPKNRSALPPRPPKSPASPNSPRGFKPPKCPNSRAPGIIPMGLAELQAQLIKVKDELMGIVKQQQGLKFRTDLDAEEKSRVEKKYHERLMLMTEELQLVQKQLVSLQRKEERKISAPAGHQQKHGGITEFVRRAVGQPYLLNCSLRSLSIPWESVAYDLLFKGVPMKVDISGHIIPRPFGRDSSRRSSTSQSSLK